MPHAGQLHRHASGHRGGCSPGGRGSAAPGHGQVPSTGATEAGHRRPYGGVRAPYPLDRSAPSYRIQSFTPTKSAQRSVNPETPFRNAAVFSPEFPATAAGAGGRETDSRRIYCLLRTILLSAGGFLTDTLPCGGAAGRGTPNPGPPPASTAAAPHPPPAGAGPRPPAGRTPPPAPPGRGRRAGGRRQLKRDEGADRGKKLLGPSCEGRGGGLREGGDG